MQNIHDLFSQKQKKKLNEHFQLPAKDQYIEYKGYPSPLTILAIKKLLNVIIFKYFK